MTERNYETLAKLERFAESRAHGMVELAVGWLATQPHVASVIAGATKPEQVEQNVQAASWRLTADELAEVNDISSGHDQR
jgi:aryl-alcohol dehydrogenase-like predicted oxidoreductase